ncbi:MAG TPA: MATE family efflux transporter, partial [Oscillospiraceae bacterium]|nr:MATE family efflux transporter [Oscillospiraceae bacterium]
IATAITTSGFLLVRFFPTLLISMFNRTPQLVEFTKPALLAWMLCMPIIGFQIIFSNFFQAIARPGVAIFLTLTRQLIFLIPSIIILPRIWGISGLWYAAPLSDALAAMLTGVWFYFGIKGLQKHADKADKGKLENQIEIDGIG